MQTIRVVCAHDCPDMCSLLAEVEGGRVVRVRGDPDQPFTAGFACAKVNRDAELVHSSERLVTPLRRVGAKGEGEFSPIGWDEALDEIVARWQAIIAESGPLALLGYAYSAHQGQMNRGLVNGLFHALGTSRLRAGTVCDTCCETAWDMTVGPIGGADPESVDQSDLVVSWGADLVATNVHFWARLEAEILPRFPPERVAAITGLGEGDIEGFAALYGTAKRSFIRLGEGMTRLARGGEALRAVAVLP